MKIIPVEKLDREQIALCLCCVNCGSINENDTDQLYCVRTDTCCFRFDKDRFRSKKAEGVWDRIDARTEDKEVHSNPWDE